MHWAIAFHPEQIAKGPNGLCRLMVPPLLVAESCIDTASGQGWVVLGRDSDVYPASTITAQPHPDDEDQA